MTETLPTPLLPIGRITWTDEKGFLPNIAVPQIAEPWQEATDAACEAAEAILGDKLVAMICRGSLARGTAVAGVSDLDLVVLTGEPIAEAQGTRLRAAGRAIAAAFPQASDIEFLVISQSELLGSPTRAWMRFILAHQGLSLRGRDLLPLLPPARLDQSAVAHDRPGARWHADWFEQWRAADDETGRKEVCVWLMKRLIRASFERVMFDLAGYTRDLYPAVTEVVRRHPERADDLWAACRLGIDPSGDLERVEPVAAAIFDALGYGRSGQH